MSTYRKTVHDRQAAFTSMELLAVVGAVVIAGAVALPLAAALRGAGNDQARCMANLRTIGAALFAYAEDNNRELPSYSTMGGHPFRIAPGETFGSSPREEAWGVQAVLEAGHAPEVLPNGLARYVETVPPAYLDGSSGVWVCPANPGPLDPGGTWPYWPDYGNTYAYRSTPTGSYNLDWLAQPGNERATPLVWDNFSWCFGFPAVQGPFNTPDFRIPADLRQAPHQVGHREFWIAYTAGGHCVKHSWTNPQPPE
ncbi:MAG TPA: hypothetical protein VM243_06755 [Phycisphaerae bacterium]|nr:hypothetical protein [Phycisphaerae bacterium]